MMMVMNWNKYIKVKIKGVGRMVVGLMRNDVKLSLCKIE